VSIRLEEHTLCLLVMIGVRADGRKELIALADGYRESAESWTDLLRDCARRGMRAPVLAVGDGALGFWSALSTHPTWPPWSAPEHLHQRKARRAAGADPSPKPPKDFDLRVLTIAPIKPLSAQVWYQRGRGCRSTLPHSRG
jgi:Transposase, Mutator family